MSQTTFERHATAIRSGKVTKTNVIGIRKAINHAWRLANGYDGNRCNVSEGEADTLESLLKECEPIVTGDLVLGGLAILQSKRWRKRFENVADIAADVDVFKLVRFDRIGRDGSHCTPVYRVVGCNGDSFLFRNIPWQTALYSGDESGPVVLESADA